MLSDACRAVHARGLLVPSIEVGEEAVTVFSFDVAFSSHDWLKRGVTEFDWHRVVVDAPDRDDAALAACQMLAGRNLMPTAIYDRI